MKRFTKLFSLAVIALSLSAFSQAQTTTVTASHLDMGPYPVSTGTVTFTPVNTLGAPIAFADGTGSQHGPTAFSCQVTTGAIVGAISETGTVSGICQVPDSTQTIPANILYSVQVCDKSSGQLTSGVCYTLQAVVGVSGSTWALDHYGPPASTTNVANLQAVQGTNVPSTCTSPSVFTLVNGGGTFQGFYTCVGGTEVAVSGGASAISSVFGRTGVITAQTGDYTVSQITGAAPLASPTFTGTPVIPGYETISLAALLAPIASPTFTGTVTAPTFAGALSGNASTATNLIAAVGLPNGTTGTTQSVGDNSTKLATDAFVLANAGTGGSTSFSGLTGTATPAQLPAATSSAQGAVELPTGQSSNILGSAAFTSSTAYDAFGAASSAITTAEGVAANASNLTSGTVPVGRVGNIGSNVQSIIAEGTSIVYGSGSTQEGVTNWSALLQGATNAPVYNHGVVGALMAAIVMNTFAQFQPTFTAPSGMVFEAGENDVAATGASVYAVQNQYMAADAWVLIPPQFRILASNATKTGTWVYNAAFPIAAPTVTTSLGTEESTTASGNTLTFSVPTSASNKIGITYGTAGSLSGSSFTVSIDGTLQTNNCSGTTTFSSYVCNGYQAGSALAFNRQEFSVTAGTTHTVVVTTTSATESDILGVDWLPPAGNPNTGIVVHAGVVGTYTPAATLNPIAQTVVSTLQADGLPIVYADVVSGTPSVNSTTDMGTSATTYCPASTYPGHPNDCGQVHYFQTIMNAMKAGNISFGLNNQSGVNFANNGQTTAALNQNFPSGAGGRPTLLNSASQAPYAVSLEGGTSNSVAAWGVYVDSSSGNPFSGQNVVSLNGGFGWSCLGTMSNSGNLLTPSTYTNRLCIDYYGNWEAKGIGAGNIASITAAATIAPTTQISNMTGATSIATITPPNNATSTWGPCLHFITPTSTTTTYITGGNIANPTAVGTSGAVAGPALIEACWSGTAWYLK